MNIALFASAFHPSLGGVEELCRQLALELMRQGHGVIVLTNRWPRDLPAVETIDGIRVYRLPFRLPEGSIKATINYHLTHRGIEREMLSILRKHQINVLHVQCVSSNAHYAMIAQQKLNVPLVVTLQGELTMDANQIFQKSPQAQGILRRALDQAQVITGCSAKTLRDGEEFYGHPLKEKARVIFNGVNFSEFENVKPHHYERPYILSLGRLAPQKGFHTLIQAFAKSGLADSMVLVIGGDGPEMDNLRNFANNLGLADRINFAGRLGREGVASYLAGCQFFVLASPAEPFGIVIIEAMAAGAPVIAVNNAGPAEIITDGVNGLLVDRSEPELLAAAMQKVRSDHDLACRMGKAAKQRASEFAWPKIASEYLSAYAAAAAGVRPQNAMRKEQ